ncbi:serine/arginine repetitive matrix protein 2-like isoform X3 [Macrosteles quadrilineatus]|uniref:serine/arginine repetitive matrix protein 2-like isoform X3 n=1 Tax=Macrosteles quadrilineatus TaxID=74068 RepID=UPI0023E1CF5F|nr:serine/arginine repetitive matrix protein 2-like isoform X3 [Macrosteles quadrilineatus]
MMAAEVSADLNIINDEDVLRRMWQQTDDFGRKKEIRQRMYKLREQRLRDFYTGDISDMTSRKHTSNTYTDSIADQGFMSLKSKEIRDSESPTRDIHRHQGDNTYWNTVQQSSYNDDGGIKSYERSSTGTGQSADGATKLRVDSDERGCATSNVSETDNAKTITDQQQHDAQISAASHTKTDSGEAFSYSTSKEHQESSSSVTEDKGSISKSDRWETSSVSSSSSRKVISSSNYKQISSVVDSKALTSGDDFSKYFNPDDDVTTFTIRRIKSNGDDNKNYRTNEKRHFDSRSDSKTFIDSETRNNIKNNLQDIRVNIVEEHFTDQDSRRDSTSTYASEVGTNVDDYISQKDISSSKQVNVEKTDTERSNNAVDQNIMTEINKLDSFLSTQNTGTNTPASPRSVMGEVNWTVVSNNDGDCIYKDGDEIGSSSSRATPVKQPDNLDLPKECTEGQYMTTYNEHYTSKRISVDVSPTHDKFARSLRQTPPGTPRSLSRQSLDRSSPERKSKKSPRSSPDKERRTSTGSYTIERPSNARRKSSEVTRQTATSRDSTLKTKRKFSTTQNKAATKVRTSTPGTSPSTSPSRKQRERSVSTSSACDSDASQVANEKKTTTNIHKRADVVRRNLMNEFDKESNATKVEITQTIKNSSSQPLSPEKSPLKQAPNTTSTNTTGILRKESVTSSKTSIKSTSEQKLLSGITPHMRETSPEYSSEGSVGKEIKNSQRQASPDSSPERTAFTPIKQFRTSPEQSSQTIQVTATETDRVTDFIKQEQKDTQIQIINIDVIKSENLPEEPKTEVNPSKKQSKPEKESPSSPVEGRNVARQNSYTRKDSTFRGKSPVKEDTSRPQSPTKTQTSRKTSISGRSPSPQKDQQRPVSPTKGFTNKKTSVVTRTPSPSDKSRSPSPAKKDSVTITTSTFTTSRKSSLKKESSFKNTSSTQKVDKQITQASEKNSKTSRSPSPKKESPERSLMNSTRSPSPDKSSSRGSTSSPKSKSPLPQRALNKRSHTLLSSPSVSPCSSPERSTETNKIKSKIICKISGKKSPERDTLRSTRRSSIPRSEQSTVIRKKVETNVEIRSKPMVKTQSLINKPKSSNSLKMPRTDSQNSMDRIVTSKTYSSSVKKSFEKPTEPIKKTIPSKKTVTTTAVISLQKPTVTSQVRNNTTSTVTRLSTYKRTSSKENMPKKSESSINKKPIVTATTKRIASRTNTPKSNIVNHRDEIDQSYTVKSSTNKVASQAFIDQLKKDENEFHGFKDETLTLEIADLEDETHPELYPETEEEEEENTSDIHHKTEKTIHVDSKIKNNSQIVVTLKKPTQSTMSKPSTRIVTTRSSSGPIKGSPQTSVKNTTKVTTTRRQVNNSVQKSDSLSMIRTHSDKNISKNSSPQKRQTSKPEMLAGNNLHQVTKAGAAKQVTETGIASQNVTTAKSATIKRITPNKKIPSDTQQPLLASSDEEVQNIPSLVTPNHQEQKFIEELEEMRQNEELEYASKLTATTNQENQLLSVIIQHPKSSRESSPDISNRSQPFCTVSDDGGANPRYADVISEPEDVEVFNPKDGPAHESYRKPRFEQVTDLDEDSEVDEVRLNVSVADRVSHFIETSKNHAATPIREEHDSVNDRSKNVLKAAAMFDTIVKNQTAPPAPSNKAPDILSRPSVFEARRGQTTPKTVLPVSDSFPNEEPHDQVDKEESIGTSKHEESISIYEIRKNEVKQVSDDIVHLNESLSPQATVTPTKAKKDTLNFDKTPPVQDETINSGDNLKTPKTDPTSRTVKHISTSSFDKKKPDLSNKQRPFEKTISASAEISSKRAFFERKSQADTPTKQSKQQFIVKERKPLTESVQNKENIRGPSPPRKQSLTTTSFIENERKSSRTSPERKSSRTSPERKISRTSPERKTSRTSPERKTSQTSPERRTSRTSPDRRSSTPAPAKERKYSIKSESPERKMSFTKSVKERRSSFTKEDITTSQTSSFHKKESKTKSQVERQISPSPERRAPITLRNFPDHITKTLDISEQQSPVSSPVKDRKPSLTRESPERAPVRKSSRTSPERSQKSPDRSSPPRKTESETIELNKAGKFGVSLRRTSSTTSAGVPRKTSTPGETQEIEDITDLSLLEIMMEKAVGYEQRRRIRAQIRIVKKIQEDRTSHFKATRQKSPTRSPAKPTHETTESRKPERRSSSPTKSYQERVTVEQKTTVRKPSKQSEPQPRSPEPEQPLRSGSPGRSSPMRKESVPEKDTVQGLRKTSKTEVEVSTSVRSQKRVETLVESGVDCITSSYGVGPTDENGRPLFGLRALRRTNTNKQLTDDLDSGIKVVEEVRTERTKEVVKDTNGRPLFGGLRALRARDTDSESDMPEQTTATQLRELVQRHEKVVKETNGPQDQPRQKPRAKLRDSFILTDDEGKDQQSEGHLSEVNNLNRGLSLKSIIQKHENIATTGGVLRSEVESSHTVVSSRTAVASDGTVSHSRDVIQGEISAKNGEEPVGKVTRSQYTYKSPRGDDEGVNKLTTTTTTLGGRRTSGPRITEVEEDGKTTKRASVTEETAGTKIRKSSLKKVQSEDKSERRFSSQEDDVTKTTVSKVSSTAQKFTTDDTKSKSSSSTRSSDTMTKTSSPTLRRQKSSEEESVEEKKKTIVRGDSVRALQHKFQQATVSSTLKQSTTLSAERRNGRQSPEKQRESPTSDVTTLRRESPSKSSDSNTRRESLSRSSTEERRESLTTTRVKETSSFLDNTTKVTGVQDILTRMRNADLVSESGDTDADREARALLNKFLGASVILQGLEQGVRGVNLSDTTPGSAALVSSVEKQRVATTRQKEEDIENIWDEQVLKNLLEQCTDYDGRRKLRARLRTVMAEHKACADLVALTGNNIANSESSESRQVTTRTEGNSFTRTEVHTRTSTNRLTKASSVSSPFAKFKQLERQNSAPSVGAAPLFRVTDPRVARSASSIKDRLLSWVQAQTREYKNIQIENFSTSWNNGLAFCALIHHFCPNAFDYDQLTPEKRRHNFELAFRVAEEEADIAPLLDVEDMVVMRRPDWKCVFTYVQSVYRRFHSTPEAVRC